MMEVDIQYFAVLRERAGKARDVRHLDEGTTPAQLFAKVAEDYGFNVSSSHVRVAVNDTFADMDAPLKHGDKVVFIPPVSGG